MATFKVQGGNKLSGEIIPQGAKNEALQILCAVLLTSKEVIIENIPNIRDVNILINAYEADLENKGFFWPEEKSDSMRLHFKSLFSNLMLSDSDVRIFHGIRKALSRDKRARD